VSDSSACGSSGNRPKKVPVTGKTLAKLIEYCESGNDHHTKPMQCQLDNTDRKISLGTFSHPREVNQDSLFSVPR
jgi:sarcosine oxidase subunit beta|tara:strand:+ start:184 stop:408 length:225 start_codon:yes stop_codon:yes gene_type:complete